MADIKSAEERSHNMAAIHSKNTAPEMYIRKKLFSIGYRYRINSNAVMGHPDIWLKKYNTAIFIHGCFWHRHKNCKYSYTPKSNVDFWLKKFTANEERDQKVKNYLRGNNIKCLIIWECSIKHMQKDSKFEDLSIHSMVNFINSGEQYKEI